ncbi:MAG TPA: YfhO family protein [Candidatus Bacteroides pullicola]|uniref:YfhO family protein n=1 Tax=Candidatus Bacteroides pullicola TaxID=2838475 RepID=A0A9D1ZH30_9BACE|nr:YfhO family protein [Candidatus Bacteroides pullicola]
MKRLLPDIIVIAVFALLSFAYFFPADTEGRILFQHDTEAGAGAGHEAQEYYDRTGERTRWTNTMFGGMPTYQISPSYDSTRPLSWAQRVYQLFLPNYVYLTFIMMLGFYILLRAFGIPAWYAGIGGVLWAFSSYFFILISAGHIWKFITLAYIPPTIGGMVLAYRGRLLAGGVVTALFVALQIVSNHVQMSYYFLFVMLFLAIAYGVQAWREGRMPQFVRATGVLVIAGLVGVAINLSNLYHTYTYSKETMRGPSELTHDTHAQQANASGGLNRDYITQWSYGIGETWTLLVPNYKGGGSVPLALNETAMEKADPRYAGLYRSLTQYFGEQPMTAGPVYVGAFVLFLFLLGCFLVKGPLKWALVAATVLSILLSWGKNMMWLTDLFIDYVPMYDKFRAVSSILVIAEFTIPWLAILALVKLMQEPALLRRNLKAVAVSLVLTAGVALWMAVPGGTPSPSDYVSTQERAMLQSAADSGYLPAGELPAILANVSEMRAALVQSDALRSFLIIAVGVLLLLLYARGRLRRSFTVGGIALLCLVDLWGVNKRYLYDDQFVPASTSKTVFEPTETDKTILADKALDYRVLNLTTSTFNENNTSYWHKSIGGYHAAKLRRYQELIDHHITPEMQALASEVVAKGGQMDSLDAVKFPVLNMLNTRYIIFPAAEDGQTVPLQNPHALGNAWFVRDVRYVANADEEMDALSDFRPAETAVVDARFRDALQGLEQAPSDSLGTIRLTSYEPNRLTYETQSAADGVAVFSEIYYPAGWQVTIDGQPAPLARANYVLRALRIPAGQHTVEMRFDPQSLHVTEGIAYAGLSLLAVGALAAVGLGIWRRRKKASAA